LMVPNADLRSDGLARSDAAAGPWSTEAGPPKAFTSEDIRAAIRQELRSFARDQLKEMSLLLQEGFRGLQQGSEHNSSLSTSLRPGFGTHKILAPIPARLLPGGVVEDCYEAESFNEMELVTISSPVRACDHGIDHKIELPEGFKQADSCSVSSPCSPVRIRSNRMACSHADNKTQLDPSSPGSRTRIEQVQTAKRTTCRQWSQRIVNHTAFDFVVAAFILLNGVSVGSQTDYMARNQTDEQPPAFQVIELIFCIIFTAELSIRLIAFQRKFFTMQGRGWNWFDFTVVSLQLIEIFMSAVASGIGMSFNLLRILRLIRVIRLARTLRLIGELRKIVTSIASSMKPLFWTGVLLFMIVYVLGVYVTQVVLHKRVSLQNSLEPFPEDLDKYWGGLVSSVFTLFQSITSGVDWDVVTRPLIDHIGPEMGLLFCFYIGFTCFAMLNVVTGVFIQAVMENQAEDTAFHTRRHVQKLFHSLDVDCDGEISWEEFESHLDKQEMKEFFKTIDVDIANARELFDLLDSDRSGTVDGKEFVDGCLNIWEPSHGLHQLMILSGLNGVKGLVESMRDDANQRKKMTGNFIR